MGEADDEDDKEEGEEGEDVGGSFAVHRGVDAETDEVFDRHGATAAVLRAVREEGVWAELSVVGLMVVSRGLLSKMSLMVVLVVSLLVVAEFVAKYVCESV